MLNKSKEYWKYDLNEPLKDVGLEQEAFWSFKSWHLLLSVSCVFLLNLYPVDFVVEPFLNWIFGGDRTSKEDSLEIDGATSVNPYEVTIDHYEKMGVEPTINCDLILIPKSEKDKSN